MSCLATWLCLATLALPWPLPRTPLLSPGAGSKEVSIAPERPAPSAQIAEGNPAAAAPLVTDRPDATESAETVGPGMVQLEAGYTFSRVERTDSHSLGEVLVRVGVSDAFELRAGFNSYEWARGPALSADGFSDTSVGIKWRLSEGGPAGSGRPALALIAATSLPTGADDFSDDGAQPELILAAGLDLSERVGLGANVGWSHRRDPDLDRRFSELIASLALGYGLSERWGAYAEYFGTYGLDGRADESFVNGGLTYLVSRDLQLDGRVGYGLNGRDDDLFVGLGAAVRW